MTNTTNDSTITFTLYGRTRGGCLVRILDGTTMHLGSRGPGTNSFDSIRRWASNARLRDGLDEISVTFRRTTRNRNPAMRRVMIAA